MLKFVFASFLTLLFLIGNHANAQTISSSDDNADEIGSSISNTTGASSVSSGHKGSASSDSTSSESDTDDNSDAISSVDAAGNMTIKSGEDYSSAIDLEKGNLVVGSGATVTKSIRVRNGNVTLSSNSDVKGNVTVDKGNLIVGSNVTITGSVQVGGNLTVQSNADIIGPVSVTSSGMITLGSNVDLSNTLTSPGSLKVGANSDVKLFLSGKSVEILGKVYKLGGSITSVGANSSVGLPYVPKTSTTTPAKTISTPTPLQTQGQEGGSVSHEATSGTTTEEPQGTVSNTESSDASNVTGVQNEKDVDSFISNILSLDENVKDVKASPEAVELDYKTKASLFGFIPLTIPAHIAVSKEKDVQVSYPWYSFLFTTDKQALQDAVVQTVASTTSQSNTSQGFSAQLQAMLTKSIVSTFKDLF